MRELASRIDAQFLCDPVYEIRCKNHSALGPGLKMSLVPQVFLSIPGEWCVDWKEEISYWAGKPGCRLATEC